MSSSIPSPKVRKYRLLVKPTIDQLGSTSLRRIRHIAYASSAAEAKKEALEKWPDANVLITGVSEVKT